MAILVSLWTFEALTVLFLHGVRGENLSHRRMALQRSDRTSCLPRPACMERRTTQARLQQTHKTQGPISALARSAHICSKQSQPFGVAQEYIGHTG